MRTLRAWINLFRMCSGSCVRNWPLQLANIIAVGAGAVVFSIIWKMTFGSPFLDVETAEYARKIHESHPQWHSLLRHSHRRDSLAFQLGRWMSRELGGLSPAAARYR